MKKTGLAAFLFLVVVLGLLADRLGIAHLPDMTGAEAPAVTAGQASGPAPVPSSAPTTGTDAPAPAVPAPEVPSESDGAPAVPGPGGEDGTSPAAAVPGGGEGPAADAGEGGAGEAALPAVALPEGAEIINGEAVVRGTVEKGDTVSKIIEGNTASGSHPYVSAARQVFSMRSFRTGQPYTIVVDPASGQLKRFEYEIDASRRLVVEGSEEPVARVEPIEYVITLAQVEATIDDNLFQAVADIGESPQLALTLGNLFGSEINFIRDLQPGDSFRVLVEKRYRDGDYKGYGRVLAAHFTNKGTTYEAYLFRDGHNRPQHYNARGENLRKTLLQAPLAFTRVTSRFSHNRKHPILGYSRPHLGVDYGAPTGTPVKAVGDGVVTRRSWAGGYGNQVIIKHAAGLESMYSHLSGYARGLRNGQRVRQGQVIGFVGSTGLSSGPHLDFRLRQNGKFVNPAKAINPRGASVRKASMDSFLKTVDKERALLLGHAPLLDYDADSIVPRDDVEAGAPKRR